MNVMNRTRQIISTFFVLVFFVCSIAFAGSQQTSSTLASTIITNARYYLNEPTAKLWSDVELLAYLNNGTMDIVSRTHCLEVVEEKTLQLNTTHYPITTSFIGIRNVIYESFDEKVTNGTMEANSSWVVMGGASAEQSTTQVYQGTYSWKFTPVAADEGIKCVNFTTVTGTTYYYSLFVYPDDETSVNIYIMKGDDSSAIVDTDVTGLTENAWNVISGSYAETAGGAGAYIALRTPTGISAGDWYVDDVSVYSSGRSKALRRGSIEHMADMSTDMVQPAYWTCWANDVIVYPEPGSAATGKVIGVYMVVAPAAVAADANVLVPAYYDKALTLYIVAHALKKDRRYAESNAVLAEYLGELDRYRMDFSYQPTKEQID